MELLTPETLTVAKEGNELLFSFGRCYQMNVEMSVLSHSQSNIMWSISIEKKTNDGSSTGIVTWGNMPLFH